MAVKIRKNRKKSRSLTRVKREPMDDRLYRFWLAHGCNFLNSSYSEGLWEPVFKDIYDIPFQLWSGVAPNGEELLSRVITLFPGQEEDSISNKALLLGSWCVQTREKMQEFQDGLVSQGHDLDSLLEPGSAPVWELLEKIKKTLGFNNPSM